MKDENLPPTRGALQPAILRANLQALQWQQDLVQHPTLPSPTENGWKKDESHFQPVMCSLPPAPSGILQLSRCGCTIKSKCTYSCSCAASKLNCTEMCECRADSSFCLNPQQADDGENDDDSECDEDYVFSESDDENN